jgi:PIN domain nuclease of toxin-antitoxin system
LILLDTHAWVWSQHDSRRLSRPAASAIRRASADGGLAVAAISLWEAAWLYRRGGIRGTGDLSSFVEQLTERVVALPLNVDIAVQAAQLGSSLGGDPGDRLIAATAVVHGLALVTADERIRAAGVVKTIW